MEKNVDDFSHYTKHQTFQANLYSDIQLKCEDPYDCSLHKDCLKSTVNKKINKPLTLNSYAEQSTSELDVIESVQNFLGSEYVTFKVLERTYRKSNKEQNDLMRKYFNSWQKHTKDSQYVSEKQAKKEKIDAFLNNIIKKKDELSKIKRCKNLNTFDNKSDSSCSTDNSKKSNNNKYSFGNSKSFQHRYQSQKNIIALQKTKLEQQERMIEELKFNKIVEDANISSEVVADVRKTLQKCDRNLKPKLKFITGEEEGFAVENGKLLTLTCVKVPKFLQKMEHRAREREEKRAIVRERRRQIDLEREKNKEQMELARQLMDQEDKTKRMNEFKERRQQEQLIAIRNKAFREKMRALIVMADLHYERKLMDKYGLETWKLFIVKIKDDLVQAIDHHLHTFIKNHFVTWKNHTKNIAAERIQRADKHHNLKLMGWAFQQLKMEHKVMVNQRQVAEDWFDLRVTERLFLQWKSNIVILKIHRKRQWEMAIQHFNSRLQWKIIGHWEMLPKINSIEREHEARKQRWRLKVQQVIPDFIPRYLDI